MPNDDQLLYETEKSSHRRLSTKTLFFKILQYSRENTCVEFLRTPILKNICVRLLLDWFYKVIVWKFVSGSHLNHLDSVILQNTSRYAVDIFNPYAFLWT